MATEWVDMAHPEVGDAKGPVTRKAFDLVWSKTDPPWTLKGEARPPAMVRKQAQTQEGESK